MNKLLAFLVGIAEFRSSYTTHYECYEHSLSYEKGREFAHKITCRLFEQ